MRAKAIAKLGFGYDDVAAINPSIVYTNCYGYGRRGPERDLPAYDDTIQAECGMPAVQEQLTGEANYVGTIMADKVAGLTALYATMMALFHRERTGEGQEVEVSMFETMASFMLVEHANGAMFDPPLGPAVYPRTVAPNRRPYRTSDGYIAALIYNDKHWNAFVDAVQPAWATELYATLELRAERHRHRLRPGGRDVAGAHHRRVAGAVPRAGDPRRAAQHARRAVRPPAPERRRACSRRCDTPHGPVRFPGVPTWFSRTPGRMSPAHAPMLGADTDEVLGELGLDRHRAAVDRDRRTWTSRWGRRPTTLRGELRELVKDHVPEDFLGAFTDDPADLETAQQFCRTLAERNLLCLAWPEEFGGGGASVWEQTVVREEMWAHHEPRGAQYMGVNWVGPIIMRHGTEEQQRKHLPPIARGEVIWCQGFSEPEAGSDLASLRTTARRDGDGWLVSGQKIWTSYATMAQWCFLLARTTQGREEATGPDDLPCADGRSGDPGPADPLHDGPAPPQRGVLRRPAGHRGRRARHRRRRAGRSCRT